MDTIFYMTGGVDAKEIFMYHTQYSKDKVEGHIVAKISDGTFDALQVTALQESALWLVASLDDSLKASLRPTLALCPTGPVLWMMIVAEVQSDSLQCCKLLAKEFEAMSLSQFKEEDISKYADAAKLKLLQLEKDNQLPRLHLLSIVDVFSSASVLKFKIHWMGRQSAVHAFVKESAGKTKAVVASMPNRIHFSDLFNEGKQLRRKLTNSGKWRPSKNAASPSPEQALLSTVKQLNAKVAQLKAKPAGSNDKDDSKSKRKCFNCGSEKHLVSNCPEKNKGGSNNKNFSPPAGGNGKWAASKDGEPLKKMIDGVEHF